MSELVHEPVEPTDEAALDVELASLEADVRGLESERDALAGETHDWTLRGEAVRELATQADYARDLVVQQLHVKQASIWRRV